MYDENGFPIGEGYDWGQWLKDLWQHGNEESDGVVTQADRDAAITLLRLNFLTSFGRTAFEKAVTDQGQRNRIYDIVAHSNGRYYFPANGGVANAWGVSRSNLPTNDGELNELSAPPSPPSGCDPRHPC